MAIHCLAFRFITLIFLLRSKTSTNLGENGLFCFLPQIYKRCSFLKKKVLAKMFIVERTLSISMDMHQAIVLVYSFQTKYLALAPLHCD